MNCHICGGHNVTWRGPMANLTHTECADCGGINCQEVETDTFEDQFPQLNTPGATGTTPNQLDIP